MNWLLNADCLPNADVLRVYKFFSLHFKSLRCQMNDFLARRICRAIAIVQMSFYLPENTTSCELNWSRTTLLMANTSCTCFQVKQTVIFLSSY